MLATVDKTDDADKTGAASPKKRATKKDKATPVTNAASSSRTTRRTGKRDVADEERPSKRKRTK